jgi:membrane-anchored protein YejM (alkaline phosphatase superfamily)
MRFWLVGPRAARIAFGVGTLFAAWALTPEADRTLRHRPRPNLVLVSVDTLRADRLSAYGYPTPTSPFLAQLAREGIVFDRFYYSGGGTLPSHMSMFTSLNPLTHGIDPGSGRALPAERTTLAELLAARGYRTAAFVDPGWMNASFGFGQGFEVYDQAGYHLEETLPRALAWMTASSEPFFLFLHTYDVHSSGRGEIRPYDCPGDSELLFAGASSSGFDGCRGDLCGTPLLRAVNGTIGDGSRLDALLDEDAVRWISNLYDGCIRYVDSRIEQLYRHLRETGRLESTLLVVISDHGEEFGEHGMLLHEQGGFEEIARIPWILRLPNAAVRGVRIEGLAAMVDVLPTLLDVLRIPTPQEAQGRSLVRAMLGGAAGRTELHMYDVLRTDRLKYFSDRRALFDLELDPLERHNLFDPTTSTVRALERRVRALARHDLALAAKLASKSAARESVTLTPEEISRLRALGYLR